MKGLFTIGAASLVAAGCTVIGPDYQAPDIETATAPTFLEKEGYSDQTTSTFWWTAFNDPGLNDLVARAVAENNRIGVAVASVNTARAAYGLARLERVPFDTISAAYTQTRASAAAFVLPGIDTTDVEPLPTNDILDASVAANWEIDLFGRVTRSIRIAEANLDESQELLRDLQSTVTAETVDAYVTYRGLQRQVAVARENIANQKETVRITSLRNRAGRGTELDVERAREQLASTMAALPPIEARMKASRYRLATLIGATPSEAETLIAQGSGLPTIEGDLPIGDPTEMLRRRPDIRAAERKLAAATEQIGLEMSAAFPKVSLTGSVGVQTIGFDEAFADEALNFAWGPTITWSLTDLMRARRRILSAKANVAGEFDSYEQTVLLALEETEAALANQRALRQSLTARLAAVRASSTAADLARYRYERGASSFLDVLDAERRDLEASNALASTRTDLARAQVAVFRALRAEAF